MRYSVVCSTCVVVSVVPGAVDTFVTVKSTVEVLKRSCQSLFVVNKLGDDFTDIRSKLSLER